jgi:hypothetical protein
MHYYEDVDHYRLPNSLTSLKTEVQSEEQELDNVISSENQSENTPLRPQIS